VNPPQPRGRSPFDEIPDQPAAPPVPGRAPQSRTAPRGSDENAPPLTPPIGQPERMTAVRSSQRGSGDASSGDDEPLLAVPPIGVRASDDPGSIIDPQPGLASASNGSSPTNGVVPPPTAAPRRGLIGSFFSNLGLNWIRR
jgi:hypothetical protein